jgi:hypothetical protein
VSEEQRCPVEERDDAIIPMHHVRGQLA